MFISNVIVGILTLFQGNYDDNVKFINHHNSLNHSFEVGENQFVNKTYVNGSYIKSPHYFPDFNTEMNIFSNDAEESVDWSKQGAVTSVKNQLDCGGCWSFSAAEAIEGEYFIKHKQLYNFSEQDLIDCSTYLGNKGCEGGSMDLAFKYVVDRGICLNKDYPFTAEDGECQSDQCSKKYYSNTYYDVPKNNPTQLEKAVTKQPVSVAIQANLRSFQLYKRGIYSDEQCVGVLDHGVLLVGYGYDEEYELDYWIIKNSWGPKWGENGYMRMVKNTTDSKGMCGIAMDPSYPVIRVWN